MMSVILNITTTDQAGDNKDIEVEQPGVGGVKGTKETFHSDGAWHEHEDHIFGEVKGKTTWVNVSELKDVDGDEAYLQEGWLPETANGKAIYSLVESKRNGWVARQIWGFKEVNGARMYARNVVVTKGSEKKRAHLYYDYKGDAQKA